MKRDQLGDPFITLDELRPIVASELSVNESAVTPEADITTDLDADSLDRINLTLALESTFAIQIPDADADKVRTVGDALTLVNHRLAVRREHTHGA